MAIVLSVLCALCGLMAGLYLGERGRRLDVQWTTNTLRPPDPPRGPARVSESVSAEERAIMAANAPNVDVLAKKIMESAEFAGISKAEAEREAASMLEQLEASGALAYQGFDLP